MLRRILVPHMRYFKNCWRYRTLKMKKWSSQWTQFMQLRKEAWKKKKKNSGLQRGLNPWPSEEHIEHCYRTLLRSPGRNDEANSHAQSTWRLHTPTICGRFVPAQCNAGLPKKKTLQQGKINRKTIQIVLVSTMPPRLSILSCYIPVAHGRLSLTREVFTWIPFRDTRIKVRWASTCLLNIRPNSFLVNTLQATNSSKIIYIGLFGACLRSFNDETAWTIGLEDFPLTYDL